MARDKGQVFVQESVIAFGFLSGIWFAIGIDPEEFIITALGNFVQQISPHPFYSFLFWTFPIAITLFSIYKAYKTGRILGIISVILAFLAGALIFIELKIALIILLIAILSGYFSTKKRVRKFFRIK